VVPDGTYDAGAATRYLSYQSDGAPSEPVALAALDASSEPVSGRQALMANATELTRQTDLEPQAKVKVGGGIIGLGVLSLFGVVAFRRRVRASSI